MIRNLYIQNFVLIDELNLEFENGFSSFTGETGAGKSVMIDAISLLCAERASSSFVMKGKDKAIIEGTFDLSDDAHALHALKEAGFETDDLVTFTREISSGGKSYARIEHRIVSLSLLRDVLANQIDIHGQRDNAYLLNVSSHERLLDEFLNDHELLGKTVDSWKVYERIRNERDDALRETYNENDLEFLTYQIEEIRNAALKEGEEEELVSKEKNFRSLKASLEKLSAAFELYDERVSGDLYELKRLVSSLEGNETEEISESVNDAYYALNDAMERLRDYYESYDMSEEDINAIEERLFVIQRLKRKYGRTVSDIEEKAAEMEAQVEMITHRSEYLARKNKEVEKAYGIYLEHAKKLSKVRREGCAALDRLIRNNLNDLMLENARFKTEINEKKASRTGIDHVEFLISMNKGEDLKPLSAVASGGELSRLMLGLKEIFTRLAGIRTVIFDEIDTGVSGPVATAIGRKMKSLSKDTQVFAVTHLAQVASCADHHYRVFKSDDENRTKTSIHLMNDDEFIRELALIASGEITDSSLAAARELMERNRT
ncbi:MAG: DNA repair protein RecN [Erysipelotrichaceae bacterium]|nr:DNA repair protein RecN [Erysipelotrichaceae bacterium]